MAVRMKLSLEFQQPQRTMLACKSILLKFYLRYWQRFAQALPKS